MTTALTTYEEPRSAVERFWARVDKSGDCWPWTGARDTNGYGVLSVGGKLTRAHRYALKLETGSEPAGSVLHRCDNPPCCRRLHLFEGSQRDNMADAYAKGRSGAWCAPGEGHARAKLTWAAVLEIRTTPVHPNVLAERFGVSVPTIYNVRAGRIWKAVS